MEILPEVVLAKMLAEQSESIPKPVWQALANLLDPFTKEVGLLLAQPLQELRFRRTVRMLDRARQFLKDRKVEATQVPLKFLRSVIDYASLEEDDSMFDRWSSLLASASTPNPTAAVLPSFPHILNELSPKEARLLEDAYNLTRRAGDQHSIVKSIAVPSKQFLPDLQVTESELIVILENLHRLRLVELPINPRYSGPVGAVLVDLHGQFCLTQLGLAFIAACSKTAMSDMPSETDKQYTQREPGSFFEWTIGPVQKKDVKIVEGA